MANLKSFKAGYGVSFEMDGVWFKVSAEVGYELENGDNSEEVKQTAWETVIDEIRQQVREIKAMKEGK